MSTLGLLGRTTIPALRRVMDLSAWKQRIHATNLANADAPGFKRQDVRFADELRSVEGRPVRLVTTHAGHAGSSKSGELGIEVYEERGETGGRIDTEKEMVSLAESQLRFNLAVRLASLRIQGIRASIRGSR